MMSELKLNDRDPALAEASPGGLGHEVVEPNKAVGKKGVVEGSFRTLDH